MKIKDYYTAPPQEIFDDIKKNAINQSKLLLMVKPVTAKMIKLAREY